jgi:hypothetical protein
VAEKCNAAFRQCFCQAPKCGVIFFVCPKCDRRQVYCSDACRKSARRIKQREANRRHQQSEEGRLDHRDRQRAYRLRRAARGVTDHTNGSASLYGKISPPASRLRSRPFASAKTRLYAHLALPGKAVVCKFCGRRGRYLNPFRDLKGTKL